VTIQLPQDLANLIEDAVQSGQYPRAEDVIRDALVRLRQARALAAATSNQSDEPSLQKKPLTKQTLQRHFAEIGLVNQAPDTRSGPDDASVALVDDEEEIISEVVINERLIEWLAGFLAEDLVANLDTNARNRSRFWRSVEYTLDSAACSLFQLGCGDGPAQTGATLHRYDIDVNACGLQRGRSHCYAPADHAV
jgi:Arc/MetJ-type ribon-helix-helix transcriptional regulator